MQDTVLDDHEEPTLVAREHRSEHSIPDAQLCLPCARSFYLKRLIYKVWPEGWSASTGQAEDEMVR